MDYSSDSGLPIQSLVQSLIKDKTNNQQRNSKLIDVLTSLLTDSNQLEVCSTKCSHYYDELVIQTQEVACLKRLIAKQETRLREYEHMNNVLLSKINSLKSESAALSISLLNGQREQSPELPVQRVLNFDSIF